MSHFKTFRDPALSLWQSAVDQVIAEKTESTQSLAVGEKLVIERPDASESMVAGVLSDLQAEANGQPLTPPPPSTEAKATEGLGTFVQYYSNLARKIAIAKLEGDTATATACEAQFAKYQQCDASWTEVELKYISFLAKAKLANQQLPYKNYQSLDDYVIDGKLPENATVGIVGDWGTGQNAAKAVLAQIARKKPDVVIHLGDIYYACTDFEVKSYFLNIWTQYFDPVKTPCFSLCGNHDMYSGGYPYYKLLTALAQPASYCCLRNDYWQFIMIDTGLHDRTPGGGDPTTLEPKEVAWVQQRVGAAGTRKSVLLSHHQLFTRYSNIVDPVPEGKTALAVNENLHEYLRPMLPRVAVWLWGHEHDMVIYDKQMEILARCVGNSAIPVLASNAPQVKHQEIAADDTIRPKVAIDGMYLTHGYAIMTLDGAAGTIRYYMDDDESTPVKVDQL